MEVRMPKMGDGMEDGTILRWIKHEGDIVAVEEPIAEIETDKANVEMPSEDAGILTKIVVKEGETVAVGTVIAYIGGIDSAPAPAAANGTEPVTDRTSTGEAGTAPEDSEGDAPPEAINIDTENAPPQERLKASPLARRMADDSGIDLANIAGSGPGGRIVERDITAFLERRSTAPIKHQAPASAASIKTPAAVLPIHSTSAPVALTGSSPVAHDIPISRMRKAIARRTVTSKQQIPHFYLTMPIEMDASMRLLSEINGQSPDTKITVNDLVVKACAVALTRMPEVNVTYTEQEAIRTFDIINIGVAVGSDEGLTIPVIPDCGAKTLRQISAETKGLVSRARAGTLSLQEMSGGTFSVTNLGMFGIEEFAAIINPPEAAILAVGAVAPEVTVDAQGVFVARKRMRVTLSCDHRAVDGLLGARFLKEVRELLEKPYNLIS